MIDPTQRDQRIREELADPETAVVLFDVVLGYGSSLDPISGLLAVLDKARPSMTAQGRHVALIGYVCGTDQDPQGRADVIAKLEQAGVLVASTNAEAATWSAEIAVQRRETSA
jgi:FdrA protein